MVKAPISVKVPQRVLFGESQMATAEIYRHWTAVAELGCAICRSTHSTTIHHCHGGSMLGLEKIGGGVWQNPGMAQKQNDWLVIPLHAMFHVGRYGIDNGMGRFKGVVDWEIELGNQLTHLEWVRGELGVDVFEKAGILHDG